MSASQIAARAGRGFDGLSADHLELTTTTVLVLLGTFDVLSEHGGLYRCRAEMPVYLTRSLAWYVAHGLPFVKNWTRVGVGDDISIDALLDAAPYLLRLMEDKRHRAGRDAEPVRVRPVSCVLVKTLVDGRAHYLFEWDRAAAQYQLFGGYIEPDDSDPMSAAAHELSEELVMESGQRLERGRDFDLRPLDWEKPLPVEWTGVSRTVGALTRYQVWVYGVRLKLDRLTPRDDCRWLSMDEMLAGRTRSGRRTDNTIFYRLMDARLAGGLAAVPVSIGSEAIPDLRASLDATSAVPTVFIGHGHSAAWRDLVDHLHDRHGYRVITFESEQQAGRSMADVLTGLIQQAQFAILVHTAEDEQPGGELRARQNVVHETGLFQGRLGFSKAIVVRQRGCEAFSNLAGLQELHFTHEIREAFGEVVAVLRREFG